MEGTALLPEVIIFCLAVLLGTVAVVAIVLLRSWIKGVVITAIWLVIVMLTTALLSDVALGYPENIRHGYPSCSSCHVSPAGGGAPNAYGRVAMTAFMSTWAKDGQENPAWGLVELPEWAALGGNMRYINANVWSKDYRAHQKFWMQKDVELVVSPVRQISFAASVGQYGKDGKVEYRRNYLKLDFGRGVTARAGRFMPAYGIMFADHRVATRQGIAFGQGAESYNGELAWVSEWGEVFATGIVGDDTSVGLEDGSGYSVASNSRSGGAGRAAMYLGDSTQLGLSYIKLASATQKMTAWGGFVMTGFTEHLYLLAEYDRKFEDGQRTDIASSRFGWEMYRGIHAIALSDISGQRAGNSVGTGLALQWFPFPHWELLGELKRTQVGKVATDTGVLMFHYYY